MQEQVLNDWERRFADYLRARPDQTDGSHDLGHFQRVWRVARAINGEEGNPADPLILLTSAYFHDLVSLPKDHRDRSESSRLSAERTAELLRTTFGERNRQTGEKRGGATGEEQGEQIGEEQGEQTGEEQGEQTGEERGEQTGEERERMPGFPPEKIEGVRHAIHAHSFSARVAPLTAEAKILQDADRMEALGAIGLARVFYTAGQLGSQLFDPGDPLAEGREPDDGRYALDHFIVKLLKLPGLMTTDAGRRRAEGNAAYLLQFLEKIRGEITETR